MVILTCVLIFFGFASLTSSFVIFGRMVKDTLHHLREVSELDENGVVTEAVLTHLEPSGARGFASAVYEYEGPGGRPFSQRSGVQVTPDLMIGNSYPIVRHHQFPSRFRVGTKEDVAGLRRRQEKFLSGVRRFRLGSAVLGLVLITTAGVLIATTSA
ncbi:hypothetical protein [Streptomyces sp. NPDC089799]|uniref:hypothetical protein n=1 Tax=Streptomyces sp. NPDC089799 TaxID=3155066 RepID=UPI00344128C8